MTKRKGKNKTHDHICFHPKKEKINHKIKWIDSLFLKMTC